MNICAILLFSLLILLAGCTKPRSLSLQSASSSDQPRQPLVGAVSSGTSTIYRLWFAQLAVERDLESDLTVVSSGEAMKLLDDNRVDFASTEAVPLIEYMDKGFLAFPVAASAVSIAYNHPSCRLTLSLSQLASVLEGRINNYRQLGCPAMPIRVVYRKDASGTSMNLNTVLSSISPRWKSKFDNSMSMKLGHGTAVLGGSGMREELLRTPGALGYLDSTIVDSPLQSAYLINNKKTYGPDQRYSELALSHLKVDSRLIGQLTFVPDGYPIVGLNWLLVRPDLPSVKSKKVRTALAWIYSKRGQEDVELLGYLRIPPDLVRRASEQMERLP